MVDLPKKKIKLFGVEVERTMTADEFRVMKKAKTSPTISDINQTDRINFYTTERITSGQWLSTSDIEKLQIVLAKKFKNLYFPIETAVSTESNIHLGKKTKQRIRKAIFNDKKKVLCFFINENGNHWTCYALRVIIDPEDQQVHFIGEYFNSMGVVALPSNVRKVLDKIDSVFKESLGSKVSKERLIHKNKKQSDFSQCGIFASWFFTKIGLGLSYERIENYPINTDYCKTNLRKKFAKWIDEQILEETI